jgi:prepilin-type N-terminal cleavage/methylation domain-containing protein/prepilin-type processing-associated H-X9-DG protein
MERFEKGELGGALPGLTKVNPLSWNELLYNRHLPSGVGCAIRLLVGEGMRQGKAFTIIELLVVIGIVAVLVAIVVPTLSLAKKMGKRSMCLSNERQLCMGMSGFCIANGGKLPAPASVDAPLANDFVYWQSGRDVRQSALAPYMNWAGLMTNAASQPVWPGVMLCPVDDMTRSVPTTAAGIYPYSYVMNGYINGVSPGGFPSSKQVNLTAVNTPSQKVLLFEEDGQTMDDGSGNLDPAAVSGAAPTTPYVNQAILCARHASGSTINAKTALNDTLKGNVAYCDGHAENVVRSALYSSSTYLP